MKRFICVFIAMILFVAGQVWAAGSASLGAHGMNSQKTVYRIEVTITTAAGTYDDTGTTFTLPFDAWFAGIWVDPDTTAVPSTAFNVEMRESTHNTDLCHDLTASCAVDAITDGMPVDENNGGLVYVPKGTIIIPYIDTTGGNDIVTIIAWFEKIGN